jgi:hypothetical protein
LLGEALELVRAGGDVGDRRGAGAGVFAPGVSVPGGRQRWVAAALSSSESVGSAAKATSTARQTFLCIGSNVCWDGWAILAALSRGRPEQGDQSMIAILVLLGLAVALALWAVGIYNGLITARNAFKNAFAQIDVQLTRRHDLIPNLVEVAKGYMAHERETLGGGGRRRAPPR